MKSFQKFLALFFISIFVLAAILYISNTDAFDGFPVMSIVLICGFIAISALAYTHVFEKVMLRTNSLVKSIGYGALATFLGVFIYSFSLTPYIDDYKGPGIPLMQGLFFITIFLFYVGASRIYNSRRQKVTLDFKDSRQLYLKVIAGIGAFTFLVLLLVNLDWDDGFTMRTPPGLVLHMLGLAAVTVLVSFLLLYSLSKIQLFRKNQIIIIALTLVITTFVNCLTGFFGPLFPETVIAYFMLVLFVTVSIVAVINYRNAIAAKDSKISRLTLSFSQKQAEYQELKNQINPHFLFNNLNTLIAFIELNPQKAIAFGHHLSNVYRYYLKNQSEDFVSLKEVLAFITEYLEIYKAKFEHGFTFEIDEANDSQYVLSAALQELTDNIFKHNIPEEENPLGIRILIENDRLVYRNSVHPKNGVQSDNSGLESIRKRYKILTGQDIFIKNDNSFFEVSIPVLILENK